MVIGAIMGGIAGGLGGSIIEPIGGTIIGSYEGAIAGSALGAITGTFLGSEVANSLNLMFSESNEVGSYRINNPEKHSGSKEHIHWGSKNGSGRENAINIDGTIRHGRRPMGVIRKFINKKFGWNL